MAPAYFRNMPGLLLAFVVLSTLAHGLSLLFSAEPVLQLPERRLGATIISTVLAPAENKPAEIPSHSYPVPSPPKKTAREIPESPSVIHAEKPSATTIAKAIAIVTTEINQAPKQAANKEKLLQRQEIYLRPKTVVTNKEQSTNESLAKQRSQQQEQQRNYLLGEIQNRLDRYLTYPIRARKRGWQGEVMITLNVNERGQLNNVHLAKSSGYSLLDRSAVTAIIKLKDISLPSELGNLQAMDLELPVRYELSEG